MTLPLKHMVFALIWLTKFPFHAKDKNIILMKSTKLRFKKWNFTLAWTIDERSANSYRVKRWIINKFGVHADEVNAIKLCWKLCILLFELSLTLSPLDRWTTNCFCPNIFVVQFILGTKVDGFQVLQIHHPYFVEIPPERGKDSRTRTHAHELQ